MSFERVIADLQIERAAVQARLDALELAIVNLKLLQPTAQSSGAGRKAVRSASRPKTGAAVNSAAQARRTTILDIIGSFKDKGCVLGQLRKVTPEMDGKDRSNALQQLKTAGAILRKGNTWVVA